MPRQRTAAVPLALLVLLAGIVLIALLANRPHPTPPVPEADRGGAESAPGEPGGLASEPEGGAPAPPEIEEASAEPDTGWRLTGVVLDAVDGRVVEGAEVLLISGGSLDGYFEMDLTGLTERQTVGADGRFSFRVDKEGLVTVAARAIGYTESAQSVRISGDEEVTLRIERGGMIRGRVTDPSGAPAAGAKVYAIPADAPDMLRENPERSVWGSGGAGQWESLKAVTGEHGYYEIRGLVLGGVYILRATHGEHAPSEDFELHPTAETSVLVRDIALRSPGSVRVRVLDPAGKPIARGEVYLDWGKSGPPRPEEPVEPGIYEFADLDPGPHSLRIEGTGYPLEVLEFEVAPGESTELIVRLEPGVSLSGVVVTDEGDPVPDVRVEARRPFGAKYRELARSEGKATTDKDGRFVIGGLRPGPHVLFHYPKDLEGIARGPVNAPAHGVRLQARRKARVSFRLVLPPGVEAPERFRYQVSSRPADPGIWGGVIRGFSGHSASFSEEKIEIPVESHPLEIWLMVAGTAPVLLKAEPEPVETLDLGVVELSVGLSLSGRVTDLEGAPVKAAAVSAHVAGLIEADDTTTSAGGDFTLRHLPPTKVHVEISADGFLDGGLDVDLARDRPALEVKLARGGLMAGRIVDAEGDPVTGLDLHVYDPERKNEDNHDEYTETNIRGEFRLRLAAGKYVIEVWRGRNHIHTAEAVLEEGVETPLRIQLAE